MGGGQDLLDVQEISVYFEWKITFFLLARSRVSWWPDGLLPLQGQSPGHSWQGQRPEGLVILFHNIFCLVFKSKKTNGSGPFQNIFASKFLPWPGLTRDVRIISKQKKQKNRNKTWNQLSRNNFPYSPLMHLDQKEIGFPFPLSSRMWHSHFNAYFLHSWWVGVDGCQEVGNLYI